MPAMRRAAADPRNALDRVKDVTFAIDQLTALNTADGPLKGRLDLQHLGMAGHSFGGWTTVAVCGEVFSPGGRDLSGVDPRITCGIAMSAPVPRNIDLDKALGSIKIPMLHLTGLLDDSPVGDTKASERRQNYDHIKAPDQTLVIFKEADHMVFAQPTRPGARHDSDERIHDLLRQCTTAFWDAHLRGDAAAQAFLTGGGFAGQMGGDGTFEHK
jgi:predicted dienelactone hydrolase